MGFELQGRTAVEGIVHALHQLVDCHHLIAISVKRIALGKRCAAEGNVYAADQLVDLYGSGAIAVAHAGAAGDQSIHGGVGRQRLSCWCRCSNAAEPHGCGESARIDDGEVASEQSPLWN